MTNGEIMKQMLLDGELPSELNDELSVSLILCYYYMNILTELNLVDYGEYKVTEYGTRISKRLIDHGWILDMEMIGHFIMVTCDVSEINNNLETVSMIGDILLSIQDRGVDEITSSIRNLLDLE